MTRSLLLPLCMLLLPLTLMMVGCATVKPAAKSIEGTPESAAARFMAITYESPKGEEMPYRFLVPRRYNARKAYPLVLFLHGAGERGEDNLKTCKHALPEFSSDYVMEKYPAFVIAPQVPDDESWTKADLGLLLKGPSAADPEPYRSLRLAMEIVEQVRKQYNIDPHRIYITGISMGGYGTWDALWRWPELFAAGAPICGGGDVTKAPLIAKTPIWVFHGGADPTVPVAKSREMVEAVKQAGGTVKYTEYPGVKHDSWTQTYRNPEFYKWLFAQKKP